MKNITVSVDEEVYHRARVRAAEQKTSVSAIVRKLLEEAARASQCEVLLSEDLNDGQDYEGVRGVNPFV